MNRPALTGREAAIQELVEGLTLTILREVDQGSVTLDFLETSLGAFATAIVKIAAR